jgi:hypothetical protein
MGMTMEVVRKATAGGKTYEQKKTLSGDSLVQVEAAIPAAKVGAMTTRTDNDTCTATMVTGHALADDDVVDVYWTVGGVNGRRLGMTAQVTGDSVVFDGGAGDNLPVNASALAVMKPVAKVMFFDGSTIQGVSCFTEKRGTVRFAGVDGVSDWTRELEAAGADNWYSTEDGDASPMAGDTITQVFFSHANTLGTSTMRASALT